MCGKLFLYEIIKFRLAYQRKFFVENTFYRNKSIHFSQQAHIKWRLFVSLYVLQFNTHYKTPNGNVFRILKRNSGNQNLFQQHNTCSFIIFLFSILSVAQCTVHNCNFFFYYFSV